MKSRILKWLKYFLVFCGSLFLLILVLAFTSAPFWAYYNLGVSNSKIICPPDAIVLMGAGGFPCEANLIRAYYAQQAALSFPKANLILALPGNTADTNSSTMRFKKYLVNAGIDSSRLLLESTGKNTRGQCLNIGNMLDKNSCILVISSPEHIRRSVLCFRKTGFRSVYGLPSFENAIETNLFFRENNLGGRKFPGPEIGGNLQVRYQFWTHLRYEVIVFREYMALFYYKIKGWI